jgi:transposase-like protein
MGGGKEGGLVMNGNNNNNNEEEIKMNMGRKRKAELDPETMEHVRKAAEGYVRRMQSGEKVGLSTVAEDIVSAMLEAERKMFLDDVPDQANGFYSRTFQLGIGKLHLKVPRVRISNLFRPALLPERWKRVDKDYENLLLAMLTNGYSRAQIQRALQSLDLPYSEDSMQQLIDVIQERVNEYRSSQLPSSMFAVFIDAYHARMGDEGRIKEISIFTALGIDFDGHKSVLGYWVNEGGENRGFWSDVFQDLISRGLKRVLMFITDDFSGVKELIAKLYPLADHQLCYVHMQRNLMRNLSKRTYAEIKKEIYLARESSTPDEGIKHFNEACDIIAREDKQYAERLRGRAVNYLAFLKYPQEVRIHIYTTNAVESINSGLELMRHELGEHFPSRQSLDINYYAQIINLSDLWSRKPMAMIHARGYELRQMMTLRYEVTEEVPR